MTRNRSTRSRLVHRWLCVLALLCPHTSAFADSEVELSLTEGSRIRVSGIEPEIWVEGDFVQATADSFVMHVARFGEEVRVPRSTIREIQMLAPISADAVRLRRAKLVSMITGGLLAFGVVGCLQGCDGGEFTEVAITWAAVTAGAAFLSYQPPAKPGKGWRAVTLRPAVSLRSRSTPMLVLRYDL